MKKIIIASLIIFLLIVPILNMEVSESKKNGMDKKVKIMPLPNIQLFERFNNLDCTHANGWDSCFGQGWMSNVFTVGTTGLNVDHIVTGVKLYMYRNNDPDTGILSVSITETEQKDGIWGSGPLAIPTKTVLATGTIPNSIIPFVGSSQSRGWVEIVFTTTGLLKKSKTYAIVVKTNGGSCSWAYNYNGCIDDPFWSDLTYGGERISMTEGKTWDFIIGASCLYEEYGTPLLSKAWLTLPLIFNLKTRVK